MTRWNKECTKIQDLMFTAVEDRLTEKERLLFDQHLKGCPSCQKRWVHYRFLVKTLRQLPRPRLSYFAEQRILRNLPLAPGTRALESQPRLFPWRGFILGMTGAGALLLIFLIVNPPGDSQAPLLEVRSNPHPTIFLRDPRTGSWLRPFELVNYWVSSQKPLRILPRINTQHPRAYEEYHSRLTQLKGSLSRTLPPEIQVEFLSPQMVTTYRAEPVEFWILSGGEIPPQ